MYLQEYQPQSSIVETDLLEIWARSQLFSRYVEGV
jgi:hypothetical protein